MKREARAASRELPKANRAPVAPRGRALAVAASLMTWVIPRRAGYRLVDLIAHLAYLGLGRYRRAALANVSQALGRPTSDPVVRAAARHCFRTSARNFWDLCRLPHTRSDWLLRQTTVEPEVWPSLRRALADGRGVIAVTGHVGAFDYASQLLALLPSRPMILTAQTTSGWLFQTVTWLRSSWGMTVEPVTPGALRRIVGHLRRGGLVGLVADRDVFRNGRQVWICGRPTTLPVGPVRLALETGAALMAVFCPREGERYRFIVREIPVERTGDAARDLERNLATLAGVIEEAIRAWPDQWVMFQEMWPARAGSDGFNVGELGIP
jgi:KDO2-lipid IV(A) lauroyltransferase